MGPIHYTVKQITGDYAILLSEDGVENQVAMALLPPGIDEGDKLLWENLAYTVEWEERLDEAVLSNDRGAGVFLRPFGRMRRAA